MSAKIANHESKAAAILGRKGGLSRSESKVRAAKENGKRGGKPKWYVKAAIAHHLADKACGRHWVCACAQCLAARADDFEPELP